MFDLWRLRSRRKEKISKVVIKDKKISKAAKGVIWNRKE